MPPITLGATLSACGVPDAARSPSIALDTTSRSDSGRPSSSFTAKHRPRCSRRSCRVRSRAASVCAARAARQSRAPAGAARQPPRSPTTLRWVAASTPPSPVIRRFRRRDGRIAPPRARRLAAEREAQHVEPWPQIGNGGGCKYANSSIHSKFRKIIMAPDYDRTP